MNILSIHDGHNATACHLSNGKIISLVSEERLNNRKNYFGFPELSTKWILNKSNKLLSDFDYIVFPHIANPMDFNEMDNSSRYKLFMLGNYILPRSIIGSNRLIAPFINIVSISRRNKLKEYARMYGFNINKVRQVEHHTAHGYAALYGSGFKLETDRILIFTCDNSGDGLSSAVAVWDQAKGYTRVQENQSFHSLGDLFARVTYALGMKPGEDEYKLMGMAPYVPEKYSENLYSKFLQFISLNREGKIVNKKYYGKQMQNYIDKVLYRERFDNICAAVQRHFEHVILDWIRFWSNKLGIKYAVFGGGCFMNVKANMLITEINELEKVFFCPSSGDESTALGAAYKIAEDHGEEDINCLESLYTGPEFDDLLIEKELTKYEGQIHWELSLDIEYETAHLLKEGYIVARFKGAAEWGARALGGRSILCRADNLKIIQRLNKSIKMRDFWMPFAASILDEDAERYLVNPKRIHSPFMMICFRTHELAKNDLIAAMHPYDCTCRAQIVTEDANPSFYRLLKNFKGLTGMGGILNTSFNLHGFPMAGTPDSAIETLLNSKIDFLAIGNYIVRRTDDSVSVRR